MNRWVCGALLFVEADLPDALRLAVVARHPYLAILQPEIGVMHQPQAATRLFQSALDNRKHEEYTVVNMSNHKQAIRGYTTGEVAKLFAVSRQTVYNWLRDEKLDLVPDVCGVKLVSAASVERYAQQRKERK